MVGQRSLLSLSWCGLSVNCGVVCNPGGAANAAEFFVVVAGSGKADALYMHVVHRISRLPDAISAEHLRGYI